MSTDTCGQPVDPAADVVHAVRMHRLIPALVCALLTLTACARAHDDRQAPPTPEVTALLELAKSPPANPDPADAPNPPKGFTRADVRHLARWLVDAVERTGTADQGSIVTERDAVDHTFAAIDMRSRVEFARDVTLTARHYGNMPVSWIFTDRWEPAHRPTRPGRIIKSAWDVERSDDWLVLSLQVVQAFRSPADQPMFLRRTFTVASTEPRGGPAVPVWLSFSAGIDGIDRCHLVRTGLFRPERDHDQLRTSAQNIESHLGSKDIREPKDSNFTAGCE